MAVNDITLIAPHASGDGSLLTTNSAAVQARLSWAPSLVTVYKQYGTPTESSTTFKITAIGASSITLGAVVTGSDQDFGFGSFVQLGISSMSAASLDSIFGSTTGKAIVRSSTAWGADLCVRVAKVAIAGVVATTGGAIASWVPAEGAPVMITRALLRTTTKSTGAATVDIGIGTNATTTSDTLIDGLDVGTAVVCADNITDGGTNGKSRQLLSGVQYLTVTGSADTTGLVGSLYVEYLLP